MKNYLYILALLLLAGSAKATDSANDGITTLTKTVARLNTLQKVQYHYQREINYVQDNYHSTSAADCYLEFDDNLVSAFQLNGEATMQIYNGTEYFELDKAAKTYELNEEPKQKLFSNFSYFFNALPALKNALGGILKDDSVSKTGYDTVLAGKQYKVVQLMIQNKAIGYMGGFEHVTTQMAFYYDIIVDPTTWLPSQVIERNSLNKEDFTRTIFTVINTAPQRPAATTWYYSTYTDSYQPRKREVGNPLVSVGSRLMDWELPQYTGKTDALLQSSSLKGKLVMMEFWIKNCGPCMESLPYLKQLQQKYAGTNLQILTINAYDQPKDIGFFFNREKPDYKMLYEGKKLAQSLGIYAYPQAILLDKTGKVIYAGLFGTEGKAEIERLIGENM